MAIDSTGVSRSGRHIKLLKRMPISITQHMRKFSRATPFSSNKHTNFVLDGKCLLSYFSVGIVPALTKPKDI